MVAVLAAASFAFTAALMLSDRAPGLLRTMFGDAVTRLWTRVDASGVGLADGRRPETDSVVHVVVWGAIAALVAMTVWSWRWLVFAGAAVFASSVLVEVSQGRFSSTRSVESSDVVANGLGVLGGSAVAGAAFVAWSVVASVIRPRSRVSEPHVPPGR